MGGSRKSQSVPLSCELALQELGSLTGLRSYYSTALEAFDFLAPLLERLFARIGDAGKHAITAAQFGCSYHINDLLG